MSAKNTSSDESVGGGGEGMASSRFRRFRQFCSKTTLHGWAYLSEYPLNSWQGVFWIAVIIPIYVVAGIFVVTYTKEYVDAGIQTSSGTKASSLGKVYFPSMTVCNINQVEQSFLETLNVAINYTQSTALYNEFISGAGPMANQAQILSEVKWLEGKDLTHGKSFNHYSSQPCKNLVLYMRYMADEAFFGEGLDVRYSTLTDATDYGICCSILPQIALKMRPKTNETNTGEDEEASLSRELFHTAIPVGSKIGEENGLEVILDIENFNFAYHKVSSQGLKVAVHDHRSKPFMGHNSMLVAAGEQTLITSKPMLTMTTPAAVDRLKPLKRDCYNESEAHLRYFEREMGYFYNLNNCFFNYALHRIRKECNCKPFFMPSTSQSQIRKLALAAFKMEPYCTSTQLKCMQAIVGDIEGKEGVAYVIPRLDLDQEEEWTLEKARLAVSGLTCLPRCTLQQNFVQHSSTKFPQDRKFNLQKSYCYLAVKIMTTTCAEEKKRAVLERADYAGLCSLLESHAHMFSNCSMWPYNFQWPTDPAVRAEYESLMALMQRYAAENLAQLQLIVKSPSVHMVKRDLSVTFVNFVGNLGGLLGLCLGFSFISLIEFVYHVVLSRMGEPLAKCVGGGKKDGGGVQKRGRKALSP